MANDNKTTVFCPKCNEETFSVTVTDSGEFPDEWGTCHWFEGNGVCSDCGYKDWYSDTSH